MGVFKYLYRRFRSLDRTRYEKHIDIIAKNTGKSKLFIKFDYYRNALLYGCGYTDYFRGDYINLHRKEKRTFVTAKSFYKILKYFNDEEDKKYLSDKILFNTLFKDYIKRDWIDLRDKNLDEFKAFLKDKDVVFAKVIDGFGGHGITKIVIKEEKDLDKLYETLKANHQFLIEEALIQTKELNEINPNSVSSFRVVTIYKDGKAYITNNALRVNQDDNEVIGCTNDLYFSFGEDGKIDSNVIDDYGNVYEEHPLTHKKFKDVCVPQIKQSFEMCKKAALLLPKERYIGWDVGFTTKGPCLIEGNEYPRLWNNSAF